MFVRSWFLQASWNPQGMQNLGLAYALYPALVRLYPEPAAQAKAVQRHLVFFNTHPYVAAAIVGGVVHHEQKIARGEEAPERVTEFKAALMGPLAALGDGFFWLSLRPASGALCAALVPVLGPWAAVLFLVLYNAVHFSLRAGSTGSGSGTGTGSSRRSRSRSCRPAGRGSGRWRRRARGAWSPTSRSCSGRTRGATSGRSSLRGVCCSGW